MPNDDEWETPYKLINDLKGAGYTVHETAGNLTFDDLKVGDFVTLYCKEDLDKKYESSSYSLLYWSDGSKSYRDKLEYKDKVILKKIAPKFINNIYRILYLYKPVNYISYQLIKTEVDLEEVDTEIVNIFNNNIEYFNLLEDFDNKFKDYDLKNCYKAHPERRYTPRVYDPTNPDDLSYLRGGFAEIRHPMTEADWSYDQNTWTFTINNPYGGSICALHVDFDVYIDGVYYKSTDIVEGAFLLTPGVHSIDFSGDFALNLIDKEIRKQKKVTEHITKVELVENSRYSYYEDMKQFIR